jgi:hypothetical protein
MNRINSINESDNKSYKSRKSRLNSNMSSNDKAIYFVEQDLMNEEYNSQHDDFSHGVLSGGTGGSIKKLRRKNKTKSLQSN